MLVPQVELYVDIQNKLDNGWNYVSHEPIKHTISLTRSKKVICISKSY
jgi:hypothetical protein